MPLMPKRVKFRKSQRGKLRGNATRGNTVTFGEFGLQAVEGGWLSAEAIEAGGSTLRNFIGADGNPGYFTAVAARVYDRAGLACRVCGTPIRRLLQGQRATFFCAHCQRR